MIQQKNWQRSIWKVRTKISEEMNFELNTTCRHIDGLTSYFVY